MTFKKLQISIITLICLCVLVSKAYCDDKKLVFAGLESVHSQIAFNVLQEAYATLGITIEHKPYPILRSIKAADRGAVDGQLFKVEGIEDEYPDLLKIPVPINYFDLMVLARKDAPKIPDWESLRRLKVGYYRGVFYIRNKASLIGIKDTYEIDTHEQLVRMIQLKRIDVGLIAHIAGYKILKKMEQDQVVLQKPQLQRVYVHHYLNKKHQHLVPQITSALNEMQRNGRISLIRTQILHKELGSDFDLNLHPRLYYFSLFTLLHKKTDFTSPAN